MFPRPGSPRAATPHAVGGPTLHYGGNRGTVARLLARPGRYFPAYAPLRAAAPPRLRLGPLRREASISRFIASRFLVFLECDFFLFPTPVLLFAIDFIMNEMN